LRACWLDDDQLHTLAARAEALRGLALPPPPGGRPGPGESGQPGG
jgi:hypothetical protein